MPASGIQALRNRDKIYLMCNFLCRLNPVGISENSPVMNPLVSTQVCKCKLYQGR